MKKIIFSIITILMLATLSFGDAISGKIVEVRNYTANWKNGNYIMFKLSKMPAGVGFFRLNMSDPKLNAIYSTILSAKLKDDEITVSYGPTKYETMVEFIVWR